MDHARIFVSTGLLRMPTRDAAALLVSQGVTALELSGGDHDPAIERVVESLCESGVVVQPHNYFPAPADPFVFNLSAPDRQDRERSISFAKAAIDVAVKCGVKRYSFHGGFLGTPKVGELGRPWSAVDQLPLDEGIEIFQSAVADVARYADQRGVRLLIENNVLTRGTAAANGRDVLLMTSPEGIERVFEGLPDSVRLLLDVAHLNVSAATLDFSAADAMSRLGHLVGGYHLSDNDGTADSNDPVTEDSWFWEHLQAHAEFATLEVVLSDSVSIIDQVSLCERKFPARD